MLRVWELEVDISCAKADLINIKVGKNNVGWGWDDWKEGFVTNMGIITGVDGVRCKYIIHEINHRGRVAARDTKTDEERLIYLEPLNSPGYDTDNHAVWHEIYTWYIGTMVYNLIREFEENEYGKAAWLVLLHKYVVTDSESKRIGQAYQDVSLEPQQGLLYKNEHILLFEKYNAGFQA